jgi:hypothetical protein
VLRYKAFITSVTSSGIATDNPFVSTSSSGVYAFKYATGLKVINTEKPENRLRPHFDTAGIPKTPFLGKVVAIVHSLYDLYYASPISTHDEKAAHRLAFDARKGHENETYFS